MASGKTDFLVLLPVSIQVIIQMRECLFTCCLVLSPVSLSASEKVDERVFAHLLACLVLSPVSVQVVSQREG